MSRLRSPALERENRELRQASEVLRKASANSAIPATSPERFPSIHQKLGPSSQATLYDDTDRETAARRRDSLVAKAQRSPAAQRKQTAGLTEDGLPFHSFQGLLGHRATYCRMQVTTTLNEKCLFTLYSRPTAIQTRAFDRLTIKPDRTR